MESNKEEININVVIKRSLIEIKFLEKIVID